MYDPDHISKERGALGSDNIAVLSIRDFLIRYARYVAPMLPSFPLNRHYFCSITESQGRVELFIDWRTKVSQALSSRQKFNISVQPDLSITQEE